MIAWRVRGSIWNRERVRVRSAQHAYAALCTRLLASSSKSLYTRNSPLCTLVPVALISSGLFQELLRVVLVQQVAPGIS